ncbi:succinate-semialdehyde dehydrogenase / glutarate-semialdehyde dehydrogenase [Sphingomonas sp. NFR04]|uniref:aldehyde dehydrogenase family protein n=1 Tax=Sphingomonas sp. NFR04 TaxID=1566283 RepID=UPI0008E5B96D|nr:aldehyde dehydrogenase family protein [Sphingomonas sp. NFR04]SFK06919.1 succinate-semialdehyde dehydrogenase / glutarate-semialdehyde dehydrogenase [Sphingomonas sp. NFR04]
MNIEQGRTAYSAETLPDSELYIGAGWRKGARGRTAAVTNPATGRPIGDVALAEAEDLADAVAAGEAGFQSWRRMSAFQRAAILRRAAALLRERADVMARRITLEQGKPLREATAEIHFSAEVLDWFADEGRRTYGRIIPARANDVTARATMEPLGLIAGFTPWNYPVGQAVRKIAIALAAGCSIIVKVAEETPSAAVEMVRAFIDAGVPPGVLQLVYGDPAQLSAFLIACPEVRAISFTGSTAVGKTLTGLAGQHLKRCVMELGGHAPALVLADADVDAAAASLAGDKFHNAGQACISPTRLLVARGVVDRFTAAFVDRAWAVRVGNGLDATTTMGPLANARRVIALSRLVEDAVAQGARLLCGGAGGPSEHGHFFLPTVLAEVPPTARILHEEPFGPVAIINAVADVQEALIEANRLPYALAAYGWSRNATDIDAMQRHLRAGMVSLNHNGLGYPEVPFGGILDSGFGDEGGPEALREMMYTRFLSIRSPQ